MTANEQSEITAGPFVAVAALCQYVLQEPDGVLSGIRFVDKFEVSTPEEQMPAIPVQLNAFISFKSGSFQGTKTARLELVSPVGGIIEPIHEMPLVFEGNEHGNNLRVTFNLVTDKPGLYWFNVSLDGLLMTRIPFRLNYVQMTDSKEQVPNLTKNE